MLGGNHNILLTMHLNELFTPQEAEIPQDVSDQRASVDLLRRLEWKLF